MLNRLGQDKGMRVRAAWIAVLVLAGCGEKHQATTVAVNRPELTTTKHLTVTSNAVGMGHNYVVDYTAQGAGTMPKITWSGVPPETKEVELMIEDPDAPGDTPYLHLLVEGIDPRQTEYPGDSGVVGANSADKENYAPPDPPHGVAHHYHIEVFAVNARLGSKPMSHDNLFKAMTNHIAATGEIVGTYGTGGI